MKRTIQISLLFIFFSIASFISPAAAQDATKELAAFTKRFEDAYNKKDLKAIKEMFTKDAVMVDTDGQSRTGNDAIAATYEEFLRSNATATITQEKVVTENGKTTATGTYQVTGTSQSGDSFESKGSYTHTVVKDGGQWKISKQVLTSQ